MYSIKIDKNDNIVGLMCANSIKKGYVKIEKDIFKKIKLPSKVIWENGKIINVENIEIERKTNFNKTIQEINLLKKQLAETDYQAIKYAEGQILEEEYQPIKEQRQAWRDKINELESEV